MKGAHLVTKHILDIAHHLLDHGYVVRLTECGMLPTNITNDVESKDRVNANVDVNSNALHF